MSRDLSPFFIKTDTDTPLTDVLKISRVLDSIKPVELPVFNEKYMMELFHRFATEEPSLLSENSSAEFIEWFNKIKIKGFIDQVPDYEYSILEKTWQDVN